MGDVTVPIVQKGEAQNRCTELCTQSIPASQGQTSDSLLSLLSSKALTVMLPWDPSPGSRPGLVQSGL